MLRSGAVDVQLADATRCGGFTGFLAAAALCDAHHIDLSGHCAPSLHCHVASAVPRLRHLEYFHDHARLEAMLFDGAAEVREDTIAPDLRRPGLGLTLKPADAVRFALYCGANDRVSTGRIPTGAAIHAGAPNALQIAVSSPVAGGQADCHAVSVRGDGHAIQHAESWSCDQHAEIMIARPRFRQRDN